MSDPVPLNVPELMDRQAELTDLRWVAGHLLQEHARGTYPFACTCPHCRAASRWVPRVAISPLQATPPAFCQGRR